MHGTNRRSAEVSVDLANGKASIPTTKQNARAKWPVATTRAI
jgi:hypothetical protein